MPLTRKAYQRAMRKRKRQARAEMARNVALRHDSIYRLVSSKTGPGFQSQFAPNLQDVYKFWGKQFGHDDPLTDDWWDDQDIAGGEVDISAVNFDAAQLREALYQIGKNKAPGEDDIRIRLFDGADDELIEEMARMFTEMANDAV